MSASVLSFRKLIPNTTTKLLQVSACQKLSPHTAGIHTHTGGLLFKATQQLWGEPIRKKKKMDPAMIKAREEKKIKRIDKEIRRREKMGRIMKPVDEIDHTPRALLRADRQRGPPELTYEECESRAKLIKDWARQQNKTRNLEKKHMVILQVAQDKALASLREESEQLYQEAIQIDYSFITLNFSGPSETPAIKDFPSTDGEYTDKTRKY